MHQRLIRIRRCLPVVLLIVLTSIVSGQDEAAEKKSEDKTSASRLKAIREIMSQITLAKAQEDGYQPVDLKPDPLLRYNDVTRGIADSVVFRVGTTGRPLALITAELYGRNGQQFLLNHEFVALHQPAFRVKRDRFVWEPGSGNLKLTELKSDQAPGDNPRLRLAQMRRLSETFTAQQTVGQSTIVLRRLTTPIDRYEPTNDPKSDGAAFAYVWGVNPEAVLFLETDGAKWFYGWAPLSSAPLEGRLNEGVVWQCPPGPHEDRTAAYTSIHRVLTVPSYFDEPSKDDADKK